MQSSIIGVVLLVHLASTFVWNNCENSSSCPEGASCVQGSCYDCTLEPVKCLRSVEICASMKCASDENCYLKQEVDHASNTATIKTVCSKTDPCEQISCANGCVSLANGDQPPVAKCLPVAKPNPCVGHKCPKGFKCFVKTSYADGMPGKKEASCADMSACDNCGFFKYCVVRVQPDGSIKGVCSRSPQLF